MKKKGFPIYWLLRTRVLLVSDCSDLLVAEKIMGFLECSFFHPVWLLRKSILCKHFFFIRPHNGP